MKWDKKSPEKSGKKAAKPSDASKLADSARRDLAKAEKRDRKTAQIKEARKMASDLRARGNTQLADLMDALIRCF